MVSKWNGNPGLLVPGEVFEYNKRLFLVMDFIETHDKITIAMFDEETSHPEHGTHISIADYITIDVNELIGKHEIPILDAFITLYSK